MRSVGKEICILLTMVFAVALPSRACTGFYVGREASADGSTLIARTVDAPPWNGVHRCAVTPRVENAPGRLFRCPPSGFEWPLPPTTWKMVSTPRLASLQKDRDSAVANERGFVVSGTVTARPRAEWLALDPYVKDGPGENTFPGLLGLVCSTCREALDLFETVIARCGHNGGEIYMFADARETWIVEVYTGHQWAAVRLPPDRVAAFGNQFMIGSFDPDSPDTRMSKDLLALPERAGKLVRGKDGLPDLYATYSGPLRDYANYRTWFAHEAWAAEKLGDYRTDLRVPLLFAPSHKITLAEVFALTRSRYEGTAWNPEETHNPKIRTIGTTKQMSCHVIQRHVGVPAEFAGTLWVALGNAEHVPYVPMNASIDAVDPAWGLDQTGRYRFDVAVAGHAFRRLAALAEQNRTWWGKGVRDFWERREVRLLAEYPTILANSVAKGEAAGAHDLADWSRREQKLAYEDARRVFDDLMWYVTANNRIEGDGSGATTLPTRPFEVKGNP